MIEAQLLEVLRQEVGDEVSLAEPLRTLGGGYYTANYSFRVGNGPPGWDRPLVLRLFPVHAPPGLAEREATVQTLVAAQGIPAPEVLLYRRGSLLDGREWFVMDRLAGRPLMGAVGLAEIVRTAPTLLRRLPVLTADTQLRLHRIDAAPLVDAIGEHGAGLGRWLDLLGQSVDSGDAPGLAGGWEWLCTNQPSPRRLMICHGDLWGGNLLVERSSVTGVIDWTMATAAEPAFDVGFTMMSLDLAPIPVGRPLRTGLLAITRWLGRRYRRLYSQGSEADLTNVPYYEVLRCAIELAGVSAYRSAKRDGRDYGSPRPAWDPFAAEMIQYFKQRTEVTITMPT